MICIGIPICRPLYKHWLDRLLGYASGAGSGGYQKHKSGQKGGKSGDNNSRQQRGYGLRTFGGGTMPGTSSRWGAETTTRTTTNEGAESDGVSESDGKGITTTTTTTSVGTGGLNRNQNHVKGPGEINLGLDGPLNEATAVGGMDWNGSEEEILGSEFRTEGSAGRGSGRKKSVDDLESAKGHGHGKASIIQVTEEWRIDRTEPVSR
jgi:hypothetical protein